MERLRRYLPALLLGSYAVFCLATAGSSLRHGWDSATFLLTGQAIAGGEGYSYHGQPFTLRPPGFPWVLSFFASDSGYDARVLNLLVAALATATVTLIYVVLRPLHGSWVALAAALLGGTAGHFVGCFNWVLSEFPFLVLLLAGIACLHRSLGIGVEAQPVRRWWLWSLAGAIAIAAAAYVRTVAVLVVPAILLLSCLHESGRRRARGLLPLAVIAIALFPWQLHSARVNAEATVPSEQFLLHSYSTALLHTDPGDPSSPLVDSPGWYRRVRSNGQMLVEDLGSSSLRLQGPIPLTCFAVLVLAGLALAVRRSASLVEGYVLASLLLNLVYFTYARRLVMPVVPFVYLYLVLFASATGRWLARRLARPRLAPAVGLVTCSVLAGVNAFGLPHALAADRRLAGELRTDDHWPDREIAAEWVRDHTPEDAVILCSEAPVLEFLTGRRAFTFRFPRRPGLVRRSGADYVVFDQMPQSRFVRAEIDLREKERWRLEGSVAGSPTWIIRVR